MDSHNEGGIMTTSIILNKAVEKVKKDNIVNTLKKLISIPSITGMEREIGEYIFNTLSEWGISVQKNWVDKKRFNVIARIGVKEKIPSLMLNGHMDTVFPETGEESFEPKIVGDKLYGFGSVDMKSGLSAMMETARILVEFENHMDGEIIFSFVVDEERDGKGTLHLVESGIRSKWAIVTEPTNMKIAPWQMGYLDVAITIYGRPAHGGFPTKGLNAIYGASKFLELFANSKLFKIEDKIFGKASFNVNKIIGGSGQLIVPHQCRIEININLLPEQSENVVRKEIIRILKGLKNNGHISNFKITLSDYGPAVKLSSDEPIVRIVCDVYRKVLGVNPELSVMKSWTDAETLITKAKIPTIIFGPGDITIAHTPEEHVAIKDVLDTTKIYVATALNLRLLRRNP